MRKTGAPCPSGTRRFTSRPAVSAVVAAASVLAPTLWLASLFPARLMLDATTATGGDLGSHNYAAAMTRELLFTRHQVTGWVPGNFGGFPLFQMYFPLPFVTSALGSLLFDPRVAFKLTSVLGVVALPGAAYACLSLLRTPFPGPALGASLVLAFLFQAGNAVWGGNLQSTLAGEIAYSISLPIALIALGCHHRMLASVRVAAVCAGAIALVALTHAYTAIWLALTAGLAHLVHRPVVPALMRGAAVYSLAGALCAFWLLPLVWYSPWTTAFKHLWTIHSLAEVFPLLLWPAVVLALLPPVILGRIDPDAYRTYWRTTRLLWSGAAAALLAYAAAPNAGIVDVRFLPFLQLSTCLIAAAGLGFLVSRRPASILWIPIVLLATIALSATERTHISEWVRWNYEGYERKPLWPVYEDIAHRLRGDASWPRVGYEHSPDHEALGTVRAFENLPLFSGRSTLEGVNLQATVTSPFVFYIQSEISSVMSCPFAEWGCSRPNLDRGVEHLTMMNVSDLIVRSPEMKAAAARHASLKHTATAGPYELYAVDGPAGYVVPLRAAPYAVVTDDWKSDAYRWFKQADSDDPVPVFVADARLASSHPFSAIHEGLPNEIPRAERSGGNVPMLQEVVEAERIRVRGVRPGEPIFVRISYHPRWQATSGEPVWLAGPGFMLVFPKGTELELRYMDTPIVQASQIVSLVGVATVLILFALPRASRMARAWQTKSDAHQPVIPKRRATTAVLALQVACVLLLVGSGTWARSRHADAVYASGQEALDRNDFDAALERFQLAQERAPLSNTAIHSAYFEAVTLYRRQDWAAAQQAFRSLLVRYPEAQAAAEAAYHIGLCAERMGDHEEAVGAFMRTRRDYPGTTWAALAADRAAALEGLEG